MLGNDDSHSKRIRRSRADPDRDGRGMEGGWELPREAVREAMKTYAEGFTVGEWVDAGHGVRMRLRQYQGDLDALEYTHVCGSRGLREDAIPLAPQWSNGWKVVQEQPLTLSPSLLCRSCGNHGFARDGKWVPA